MDPAKEGVPGGVQPEHTGRDRKGQGWLGVSKQWGWSKGSTLGAGKSRLKGDPGQITEALIPGYGVQKSFKDSTW